MGSDTSVLRKAMEIVQNLEVSLITLLISFLILNIINETVVYANFLKIMLTRLMLTGSGGH